jgi:hypothetical protein
MPKRPRDSNQLGKFIVDVATGNASPAPEDKRDPVAVAHGRQGGLKGGKARAKALSAKQRSESARKAVLARWASKAR